jgi:hypothetical protein
MQPLHQGEAFEVAGHEAGLGRRDFFLQAHSGLRPFSPGEDRRDSRTFG